MAINSSHQTGRLASDINLSNLVLAFQVVSNCNFMSSFPSVSISVKEGLPWICMLQNEACVQIFLFVSREAAKGKCCSPTASVDAAAVALEQLQMQQFCQVMRASLALSLYNKKDTLIGEFFLALLRDDKGPVMLVNAGEFVQFALDYTSRSGHTRFRG